MSKLSIYLESGNPTLCSPSKPYITKLTSLGSSTGLDLPRFNFPLTLVTLWQSSGDLDLLHFQTQW